ncbi:DNA-directed RNA polymerase subunit beta [Halalkalibacter akibai]|uniref:DNA-directed RNA polymerase subunit beta n=1 Tax=Halalkalibacter akibai (strain ATCC 43226 / DSM 21942 / CIP 109018 / JCM 9157 / 1139) TaxID=1236973 RepID=W4QPR9_HALA3|nr:DNA-directed RNA polymerase subunit beta [Halalkalibacter akibai]GAE33658.1 hypothetical protein JCM9157_678 [Halalkalibacter akibai JCM 9157]
MTDKRSNPNNQHTESELDIASETSSRQPDQTDQSMDSKLLEQSSEEASAVSEEKVDSSSETEAEATPADIEGDKQADDPLSQEQVSAESTVERSASISEEEDQITEEDSPILEQEEDALIKASAKEEALEEEKQDTREVRRKKRRVKKPRLRLIPIWLRILISIVLIGGSLILGLMFGYGVIGGGEPGEAIRPDTWYHIIDIIRGN